MALEDPTDPPARARFAPPAALMAAFLAIALETDSIEAILLPSSAGRREVRALHFTLASLQLLACGALLAGGVMLYRRAAARSRLRPEPFVLAIAIGLGVLVLPEDLAGLAEKISEPHAAKVLPVLVVGAGVLATALLDAMRWSARRLRIVPVIVGLGIGAANPILLAHDYPGIHLIAALVAAAALAHGLAGLPLPVALVPVPVAGPALGAALVCSLAVPIPNAVLADMLRATGAVVAPFVARFRETEVREVDVPAASRPWFSPRAKLAPVKPRGARLLPADGVVVLVTVDALRADVINSGKYDAELPNFAALRDHGVRFTQARSPGSQTVPVITGLMTGKYYSQLYWSGGAARHAWSTGDTSLRFPESLRDAGVVTVTMPTLPEVMSAHGTVRGFVEDRNIPRPKGEPSPLAATITERVVRRLNKAATDGGPLFLYVHYVDAHDPYTRGGTDCEPFDCYVREVALIDAGIGEIRDALDAPAFAGRTVFVATADHGEAFGEHDQRHHATTLYEELLRVPLLVSSPLFPAHEVDTPVTLLDLGPTFLELFGRETPAAFMGESLVRLLRGEPDTLTRPIAADSGRLMQALVFPDGMKIIRTQRTHTVELYDLKTDPGELHSVYETTPDAPQRRAMLDALFRANAYRAPGYSPPWRK